MKKIISTVAMIFGFAIIAFGQCSALFSYIARFDTVTFTNQSSVSNAHYFWNFGDGVGSNLVNPVHIFPGSGDYLVTLFAKDTVSNCSSYYEHWVNVTKYSNNICQPRISDSIYDDTLHIYSTAANCNGDIMAYSAGPNCIKASVKYMQVGFGGFWKTLSFRVVCAVQYYDRWGNLQGVAYKTAYHNYSSSHNYGDSSANFEFLVISRDSSHERILYTAMNKTAKSYEWHIYGFGNPIISYNDTISELYTFNQACPTFVGLMIEGSRGYYDTIYQNIHIGDSAKTVLGESNLKSDKEQFKIYPNPSNGLFAIDMVETPCMASLQIYNMMGQKIFTETLSSAQPARMNSLGGGDNRINLSNQPNGIYLYRVVADDGSLMGQGKLIIEH